MTNELNVFSNHFNICKWSGNVSGLLVVNYKKGTCAKNWWISASGTVRPDSTEKNGVTFANLGQVELRENPQSSILLLLQGRTVPPLKLQFYNPILLTILGRNIYIFKH